MVLSDCPDLVMIPRDDRYVYNERPGYGEKLVAADSTTGTHSRDGIFIAWGPGIKAGADSRFTTRPERCRPDRALASLGVFFAGGRGWQSAHQISLSRNLNGNSARAAPIGRAVLLLPPLRPTPNVKRANSRSGYERLGILSRLPFGSQALGVRR